MIELIDIATNTIYHGIHGYGNLEYLKIRMYGILSKHNSDKGVDIIENFLKKYIKRMPMYIKTPQHFNDVINDKTLFDHVDFKYITQKMIKEHVAVRKSFLEE